MANSYSESIVSCPHSLTQPIPIAISSSQSPLLSVTPVRCMDTANIINFEVWVCYSFSKHNIFSAKAKESFVVVWIMKRSVLKTSNAFLRLSFQKHSHFRFVHKDNAKWCRVSSGSLVLLLFTRFLLDCTEISVYGSSEVYWSRPDVLGCFARSPAQMFSDAVPLQRVKVHPASLVDKSESVAVRVCCAEVEAEMVGVLIGYGSRW